MLPNHHEYKNYNKTNIIVIKSYNEGIIMLCNNIKIMFHAKKAYQLEFNCRVACSKYDPKHNYFVYHLPLMVL